MYTSPEALALWHSFRNESTNPSPSDLSPAQLFDVFSDSWTPQPPKQQDPKTKISKFLSNTNWFTDYCHELADTQPSTLAYQAIRTMTYAATLHIESLLGLPGLSPTERHQHFTKLEQNDPSSWYDPSLPENLPSLRYLFERYSHEGKAFTNHQRLDFLAELIGVPGELWTLFRYYESNATHGTFAFSESSEVLWCLWAAFGSKGVSAP